MTILDRAAIWTRIELGRLVGAVRGDWKRILAGAFTGWLVAVVLGAFTLAALEAKGLLSRETSDELGIVIVLYGVGLGALNGHALRPAARRAQSRN